MLLHVQAAAMAARDQREESETPLDLWSREFDLKADMPMKAWAECRKHFQSVLSVSKSEVLPFGHSSCGPCTWSLPIRCLGFAPINN